MIIAQLFLSVLCVQAATATPPTTATAANKPAAIAVTMVANIGPTVDVPADLAALVPSDAVAVILCQTPPRPKHCPPNSPPLVDQ